MNKTLNEIDELRAMSKRMKLAALEMIRAAGPKGAHVGGGFSCMEIMAVLYGSVLRISPEAPLAPERDRLLISKNHCTLAHFPALAEAGFIKREEICSYSTDGSRLIGYPYAPEIGIEYSGGSLGMAISVGIGQAISAKKRGLNSHVYVLMGDGELNEGSIWEGLMSAAHFGLSDLTVIIDRNHLCYDGTTDEIMSLGDLGGKFEAFGFNTISCNGHDIDDLLRAFGDKASDRPNAIIADTVKGHGISFAEGRPEWHQKAMTDEQYELAVKEIMEAEQ